MGRYNTLLPDNETPLMLALEENMAKKYCRVDPDIIKKLQDPWECPVKFLPWLAYANSVDIWNDKWPEQTKRTVIANARELHAHKGTRGGLEDALAILGVHLEMTSWQDMQPEGEVGTIDLMIWINDSFNLDADVMMNSQMLQDIDQTIKHHKRLSVHYSLKTGIKADTAQFSTALSAQGNTHQRLNAEHDQLDINAGIAPFGVALSAQGNTHQRLNAEHDQLDMNAGIAPFGTALSAQGNTHQRLNAEHDQLDINAGIAPFGTALSAQATTLQRIDAISRPLFLNLQVLHFLTAISTQAVTHLRLDALMTEAYQ